MVGRQNMHTILGCPFGFLKTALSLSKGKLKRCKFSNLDVEKKMQLWMKGSHPCYMQLEKKVCIL